MSSLTTNLEDVLRDLRPAADRVATQGRRRRRLRLLAITTVAVGICAAAAVAARFYLGQPAPSFLKAELAEYDKGLPSQYRFYPDVAKAKVVATNGHVVFYAAPAAPRGANATSRAGYCTDLVGNGGALGWNWICNETAQVQGLTFHYAATDPTRHLPGETVAGRIVIPHATGLELHYRGGTVDRIPLGLDGYYVFDIPPTSLAQLRRAPATAIVRGPRGTALYRTRIPAPVDASFRTTPDGRVTQVSGRVASTPGGQVQLYFALSANGVHPKLNSRGQDISTSAQAQVQAAADGSFSFDVPAAWQRYQSISFAATTRGHPYGCTSAGNCSGFVAAGYAPEPKFWAMREHAFRKSKG